MARFYGYKSRYLLWSDRLNWYVAISYFIIFLLGVFLIFFAKRDVLPDPIGIIVKTILIGPFILYAVSKAFLYLGIAGKFFRGRRGEGRIFYYLKNLPDSYVVLQDLKIGKNKGNVDFVVVCRTGIYAIEVKSHVGKIEYDGYQLRRDGYSFEKDILKQARGEAAQISDYLNERLGHKYFVKPIIVFSSPKADVKFHLNSIDGVYVIGTTYLEKVLELGDRQMSEEGIIDAENTLNQLVFRPYSISPKYGDTRLSKIPNTYISNSRE